MLHRVIYASEAVGATGASTLSIAQILGVSERNNRRADLDRLLRVLLVDPRHTGMRILVDLPVSERLLDEPMSLYGDPSALLSRVGLLCLSRVTAREAEILLDFRKAA